MDSAGVAPMIDRGLRLTEAQQDAFEVVRKLVMPQLVKASRSIEGLEQVADVLEYAAAECRKVLGMQAIEEEYVLVDFIPDSVLSEAGFPPTRECTRVKRE